MPLPSLALIKSTFPRAVIEEQMTTFQNYLLRGRYDGRAVYLKSYGSAEHYHAERNVLLALAESLVALHFRKPELLAASEAIRTLVFTALTGTSLAELSKQKTHMQFASVLRSFHDGVKVPTAEQLDMGSRLKLYARNILNSEALDASEKKLAIKVTGRLQATQKHAECAVSTVIHGDMNAGNILYAPNSGVPYALIDFERVCRAHPFTDIAKYGWRVLKSDLFDIYHFLAEYQAEQITLEKRRVLHWYLTYEYLGAISYFAYRGFTENYPYKDDAFNHIEQCLP